MDINSKEFKDILLNTHNEFRKHTAMWGSKKEIEAICERTGVDKQTARQALYDMEHPYGKGTSYTEDVYPEFDAMADEIYKEYMSGAYGKDKVKAICNLQERTGVDLKTAMDAIDIRIDGMTYSEKQKKRKDELKARDAELNARYAELKEQQKENWAKLAGIMASSKVARCPKCHSTSIAYDSKKVSVGRAIVGNAVAGPTGAIIGGLSGKKGYAVCLNCGKRWKI